MYCFGKAREEGEGVGPRLVEEFARDARARIHSLAGNASGLDRGMSLQILPPDEMNQREKFHLPRPYMIR